MRPSTISLYNLVTSKALTDSHSWLDMQTGVQCWSPEFPDQMFSMEFGDWNMIDTWAFSVLTNRTEPSPIVETIGTVCLVHLVERKLE